MKLLRTIPLAIVIFYFGLGIFIFFKQEKFIFFPSADYHSPPDSLSIKDIYFSTDDHIRLHAWFLDNNADKTVLFFHGNGGNLTHRTMQLKLFSQLDLNAMIIDYRGYGQSQGRIKKEADLYADSKAALRFLTDEKCIKPENIIIWGRSLGGAAAAHIAQNESFFAVIMESAFCSLNELAKERFRLLPTRLLLKYHFRNNKKIKNIQSRLLVIHSPDDEIIPFEHGKRLFDQAPYPKTFLKISGSHNTGFYQSYNIYKKEIADFLNLQL